MSEPQRARHYAEMLNVIRARVAHLGITHETLDSISGLQGGYSSKVLCRPPIKHMSGFMMFLVLEALGLQTTVTENCEALKRIRTRLSKRKLPRMLSPPGIVVLNPDFLRINGRKGGRARLHTLSQKRRSAIARKAAKIRWSRAQSTNAIAQR